jgi:hypothetical protein
MDAGQPVDLDVRVEVYRFFVAEGRPPVPAEVGASLELPQADVEDSLNRLADAHVLVLAPGTPYIWMANPLSALPTPYRVEAAGRTWFGNCIWDALGIVAMLGGDGTVTTWCADCGDRLVTEVTDDAAAGDGVVHFAVPAARWWDNIGFN